MAPQRVYSEFSRSNYKAEQPLEQTLRGEKKKKTHNIYKDVYGYIAFLHVLFIFIFTKVIGSRYYYFMHEDSSKKPPILLVFLCPHFHCF